VNLGTTTDVFGELMYRFSVSDLVGCEREMKMRYPPMMLSMLSDPGLLGPMEMGMSERSPLNVAHIWETFSFLYKDT